jgi:hypothetical protein
MAKSFMTRFAVTGHENNVVMLPGLVPCHAFHCQLELRNSKNFLL